MLPSGTKSYEDPTLSQERIQFIIHLLQNTFDIYNKL